MWVRLSKWGDYPELPRQTHSKQKGPPRAREARSTGQELEATMSQKSEVKVMHLLV